MTAEIDAQVRVGQTLNGKYVLQRLIDVGGMAAVYEAVHRNGSRCAIKLLHTSAALNHQARERFLREGYAANRVNHPGAVAVLDDDTTPDGLVFLVMELLSGNSLEGALKLSANRMDLARVVEVSDQVLDVLAAAHDQGIIHRDIKPANVFLTQEGKVKVLDFGLARMKESQAGLTSDGMIMGTLSYMPPEQARAKWSEVDHRADLFAVGALMFRSLTGQSIHQAATPNLRMLAAMRNPAPPIRSILSEIPEIIAAVIDKALAFDRNDRWPDARSMQSALRVAFQDKDRTSFAVEITELECPSVCEVVVTDSMLSAAEDVLESNADLAKSQLSVLGQGDMIEILPTVSGILVNEVIAVSTPPHLSLIEPIDKVEPKIPPVSEVRPTRKDGPMVVLLVEDEEMNRDMLGRRLIRRGYEVLFAADGQQAISMTMEHTPDLVLMDMSLPVLDGWEATRRLRTQVSTAKVPIIALTAHSMMGDREKAISAGCDDYDTKPIDMARLLGKMETLLAVASSAQRLQS